MDLTGIFEYPNISEVFGKVIRGDILAQSQIKQLVEESNQLMTRIGLNTNAKFQFLEGSGTVCFSFHDAVAELDITINSQGVRYLQLIEIRPSGHSSINMATCRYTHDKPVQVNVKDIALPTHQAFMKQASLCA